LGSNPVSLALHRLRWFAILPSLRHRPVAPVPLARWGKIKARKNREKQIAALLAGTASYAGNPMFGVSSGK
jgi:hypothetical protein